MMFNNSAFSSTTIQIMQPSMEHLYRIAKEKRQVNTPAAVGRVMTVSQQRLKNWEIRGISKEGALLAQSIFGIDSNALLAMNVAAPTGAIEPPVYETGVGKTLAVGQVQQPSFSHTINPWPFETVTTEQWRRLTPHQRLAVESVAQGYINTADPPLHYEPPEQSSAAA